MANNAKKSGKKSFLWIWILAVAILGAIGESAGPSVVGVAVLAVVVIGIVLLVISGARKRRSAAGGANTDYTRMTRGLEVQPNVTNPGFFHTHDRISRPKNAEPCTPNKHYKAQLDSLYRAGIIDRKEYAYLAEKFARVTDESSQYLY